MANKRIKDLATTKYTGFMALDDADGTGKMDVDTIFNNFAGEFEENVTNCIAGKLYMHSGVLYKARYNYTGVWNPSMFTASPISDSALVVFANPSTSSAPYDNLNDYPLNSVILVSTGVSDVSNKPNNDIVGFGVVTFGAANSLITQILSDNSKKTYIRNKFGSSWGGWLAVELGNQIVLNPSISSAPYNDLNTYPLNSIVQVSTNAGSVANVPDDDFSSISVLTYGAHSDMTIQILNANDRNTYIRSKFGSGSTWGTWLKLTEGLTPINNPSTATAPYNDLNNYPRNSIVQVSSGGGSVLHNPSADITGFSAFTFGSTNSLKMQILAGIDKRVYIRSLFGSSWGSWIKVSTGNEIVLNPTTTSAPYNDLNTYPLNSIVQVSSTGAQVSNKPVADTAGFACYTYGAHSTLTVQIYSDLNKQSYIRNKFGSSWGNWVKISDVSNTPCDVLSAFTNIICVGDSLTESQVWTSDDASDVRQAYKTYPAVLATITGAETTMYAKSGDDSIAAWNRHKDNFVSKLNALAIVYLGTNHGLTDTLSTDAPTTEPDYNNWADTNTGCYAKIVAKLQSLGYKVLLVRPYAVSSPGDLATTQDVVNQVATRFNCSVVGPIQNTSMEFHYYPDRSGYNGPHFNDLGYSWFAHKLVDMVASLGDNLKFIIPV